MKISKIEKNIPVPEVHSAVKYPWPMMEVGDSVLIQANEGQTIFTLKRLVGPSARYYGEKTGKKFKTLLMHKENGVRVWRLK